MFRTIIHIIVYLALAILIGSVLFFGAGVASVVFQPGILAGKTMAGAVNAIVLRRLGMIELFSSSLVLGGVLYLALTQKRFIAWMNLALAAVVLSVSVYTSVTVFPKMDRLRIQIGDFDRIATGNFALKEQFDSGHKQYSMLTGIILIGSIGILIFQTVALTRASRATNTVTNAASETKPVPVAKSDPAPAPKNLPVVTNGGGKTSSDPAPVTTPIPKQS